MAASDLGDEAEAYQRTMPFSQSYAGLKRYWESRVG
jgi:hypothetical protein